MLLRCFVGSNNIAHRITKAYIGDQNGIAKTFYNPERNGIVKNSGVISSGLSTGRIVGAATSVGNYALFAGGSSSSTKISTVDVCDENLVTSTATSLSKATSGLVSASLGNYAIFIGGTISNGTSNVASAVITTYDKNLVKGTFTSLTTARSGCAAATAGDYVLITGGGTSAEYKTVESYSSLGVKSTANDLSYTKIGMSGASIGNYALFGAGKYTDNFSSTVDVYNSSLIKNTNKAMHSYQYYASISTKNYAFFGGGYNTTNYSAAADQNSNKVKCFDKSLVAQSVEALTNKVHYNGGSSLIDTYAIFVGGNYGTNDGYNSVDIYDDNLIKSTSTISSTKYHIKGASVGDYALFAGSATYTKQIETFQFIEYGYI